MTVKTEAFLALEKSLVSNLAKKSKPYITRVATLVGTHLNKSEYTKAYAAIDELDASTIIDKQSGFIKYIAVQAVLYGARDFSPAKETKVFEEGMPELIDLAVASSTFNIGRTLTKRLQYIMRRLVEVAENESLVFKSDKVRAFVSTVLKSGGLALDIGSSLHTSRLATWGFLQEATLIGHATFRVSEILDTHICPVCRIMDGRVFSVSTSIGRVERLLTITDPNELKSISPFPPQSAAAIKRFRSMSDQELIDAGWETPPYHPLCRGILRKSNETVDTITLPNLNDNDVRDILNAITDESDLPAHLLPALALDSDNE